MLDVQDSYFELGTNGEEKQLLRGANPRAPVRRLN